MSEKMNEAPEIIYTEGTELLWPGKITHMIFAYNRPTERNGNFKTAYILKQTHDKEVSELKAEIERLKAIKDVYARHFKPPSEFYDKK